MPGRGDVRCAAESGRTESASGQKTARESRARTGKAPPRRMAGETFPAGRHYSHSMVLGGLEDTS